MSDPKIDKIEEKIDMWVKLVSGRSNNKQIAHDLFEVNNYDGLKAREDWRKIEFFN